MKNIISLASLILFVSSCTKVIDVDLNTASPQYVIQSVLFAGTNDFEVDIKQTTSYFDPETPAFVENATVTLFDYNNIAYPLLHSEKGLYTLSAFTAEAKKSYKLVVSVEGNSFEAEVIIPEAVSILHSEIVEEIINEGTEYEEVISGVYVEFQDPANINNYYQFEQRVNSNKLVSTALNITDDFSVNGLVMSQFVYIDFPIESGDTIWTELRSIDSVSFYYFSEVANAAYGGGGLFGEPTPANPKTNWSNSGLGYFSPGNSDYSMIIVP
jgi:hypothetical protein